MGSTAKISYRRLVQEGGFDDDCDYELRERIIGRPRSWSRPARKVHLRKRLRVRIPSLRRLLRRKARLLVVSCARVLKRLKEGKSHFGDLFAGNYLFMQVNPAPLKCVGSSHKGTTHHGLHGLSSRYSLPKIAS